MTLPANDYANTDENTAKEKYDHIQRENQLYPIFKGGLSQRQAADQSRVCGVQQVGEAVTQLESQYRDLTRNPQNISQRRHDRHNGYGLTAAGGNGQIDDGVGNEHANSGKNTVEAHQKLRDVIYDRVQNTGHIQHGRHTGGHNDDDDGGNLALSTADKRFHGAVQIIPGYKAADQGDRQHDTGQLSRTKGELGRADGEDNKPGKKTSRHPIWRLVIFSPSTSWGSPKPEKSI